MATGVLGEFGLYFGLFAMSVLRMYSHKNVIIYSFVCHSKPVWFYFCFEAQKETICKMLLTSIQYSVSEC